MGIFRTRKENNYVVMHKAALQDQRLSWKAKGLHAYMMSMPDDWIFHNTELQKHAKDGRESLETAIKELKSFGYMKRERHRGSDGRFVYETIVFETAQEVDDPEDDQEKEDDQPDTGLPLTGKPLTGKPLTENPQLLINNELSIDELSNNSTKRSKDSLSEDPTDPPKRPKKKRVYEEESKEYRLANLLKKYIEKNELLFGKEPNMQKWADDIRKMIELDEIEGAEIQRIIIWSQTDTFWKGNILSTKKLRDKFPTLVAQSRRDKPSNFQQGTNDQHVDYTSGDDSLFAN